MTAKRIDLNRDVGESFGAWTIGNDEALMPYLTSASIACGWHGGDPQVMRRTVRLARTHAVSGLERTRASRICWASVAGRCSFRLGGGKGLSAVPDRGAVGLCKG